MDHAKLLDVLMSLPVSHAILPRAVCFATSRPANNAICSYIDSSGYASGPMRICLFIDNIIMYIKSEVSDTGLNLWHLYFLKPLKNRGSYMSAHVLLNLLKRLRKKR